MNKLLLKRGDIIRLEPGMRVYTTIPEMFHTLCNHPLSTELSKTNIEIGKILHSPDNIKTNLTTKVKEAMGTYGITVPDDAALNFIDGLGLDFSVKDFDTNKFAGEYTVYFAAYEDSRGGALGAHHVYCSKNDDQSIEVDFYQGGPIQYSSIDSIKPLNREV